MFKCLVSLLLALSFTPAAFGKSLRMDESRTILIEGGIDGNIVPLAFQLEEMTRKNRKPVYLVLNSPGGQVIPMMVFLQAMSIAKNRGVTIKCVAPILAASAAFQIFANCSERYAFKYSFLLFHPVRTGGQFRDTEMLPAYRDMKDMQNAMVAELLAVLGMDEDLFWFHFNAETLHRAVDLQKITTDFLTLIDDVEGLEKIEWFKI